MTLQRVPGSEKALLLDVLDSLPDSLVREATHRDKSTLYGASHPNSRHGLHLPVAAGLDAALIVQGYSGVFLPWAERHRNNVIDRLGGPRLHDPMDPLFRLAELVGSIGDVSDELRAAKCARGVAGSDIVEREADRVRARIAEARRSLDALEKDLDATVKPERPVDAQAPHLRAVTA